MEPENYWLWRKLVFQSHPCQARFNVGLCLPGCALGSTTSAKNIRGAVTWTLASASLEVVGSEQPGTKVATAKSAGASCRASTAAGADRFENMDWFNKKHRKTQLKSSTKQLKIPDTCVTSF